MKFSVPVLLLFPLIFASMLPADEIVFKSGKKIEGKVLEYKNGRIKIRNTEGKEIVGDIDKIESMQFDSGSPETVASSKESKPDKGADNKDNKSNKAGKPAGMPAAIPNDPNIGLAQTSIEKQLATIIANTEKTLPPNYSAFAIYLDTDDPRVKIPQGSRIEYKCYGTGGGYSGSDSIPLRQAWTRNEFMRAGSDNGSRRVEIDPGPPFETINLTGVLEPGKVTNLGRVVLKKVVFEGTASISGIVTGEDGKPIEGALVSDGKRSTKTDKQGEYKFDGYELERVQLKVTKSGYFGAMDYENIVSVRNMDERMITRNLKLFKAKRLKLKYVISDEDSNSFEGPGVENGTIELLVNSSRFNLQGQKFTSNNFSRLVDNFRSSIAYQRDAWVITCFYHPMFVRGADASDSFESIKSVNDFGYGHTQCPPLTEGQVILIRGFPKTGEKGVSRYCVKILVEEFRDE